MQNFKNLEDISKKIRRLIIDVSYKAGSPHTACCLSCVEILVALYFYKLRMKNFKKRDIFVLSKAHAALSLYCTLMLRGFLSKKDLYSFYSDGGKLPAHLDRFTNKAIEASCGSLGHGFSIALGMAYGYKIKKDKRKVFTLIGDGEAEEGSIWEGALFASRLNIDNFVVILDYNNLQGYGFVNKICYFEPIKDKWQAFGWDVVVIDGHNFKEIINALDKPNNRKPRIIIAKTIKGKGISFMENDLKWHYYVVTKDIRDKAYKELL